MSSSSLLPLFWLQPLVIRRMHRSPACLYIHVGLEQRDKKAEEKKKTKLLTMKGGTTAATDHALPAERGEIDVGADRTRPLA